MKIREWFIHKLGGFTKKDLKFDVSSLHPTNIYKHKKLYAQYETLDFKRTKEFEDDMKIFLCEQLSRQLFDYVKFYDVYKVRTNSILYRVEIEVLDYTNRGDEEC